MSFLIRLRFVECVRQICKIDSHDAGKDTRETLQERAVLPLPNQIRGPSTLNNEGDIRKGKFLSRL